MAREVRDSPRTFDDTLTLFTCTSYCPLCKLVPAYSTHARVGNSLRLGLQRWGGQFRLVYCRSCHGHHLPDDQQWSRTWGGAALMSLFVSIVHSSWSAVCVIFFTARQIGSDACFIPPGCDLRQMHKYLPTGGARISLVGPQLVHLLLSS
jgi:hypothetical protein